MGNRGPHPEPTQVKVTRGTFRPGRDSLRFDTIPASGKPEPPTDLEEGGKALWESIIAEHAARKTLGTIDTAALGKLCQTFDICEAARKLAKRNPTDKDARCSYLGYLAACDKLGAKFGWTASDRANMKIGSGKNDKPSVPTRQRA